MLGRLRLLLAMSLLCLGTWFAAQALEGYLPAGAAIAAKSGAPSHAKPPIKSLETKSPQDAGNAKPAAAEKRRSAGTAQLPWPLNLFAE
jgi:hypothetical protein